jgi:hypothetical protein
VTLHISLALRLAFLINVLNNNDINILSYTAVFVWRKISSSRKVRVILGLYEGKLNSPYIVSWWHLIQNLIGIRWRVTEMEYGERRTDIILILCVHIMPCLQIIRRKTIYNYNLYCCWTSVYNSFSVLWKFKLAELSLNCVPLYKLVSLSPY